MQYNEEKAAAKKKLLKKFRKIQYSSKFSLNFFYISLHLLKLSFIYLALPSNSNKVFFNLIRNVHPSESVTIAAFQGEKGKSQLDEMGECL